MSIYTRAGDTGYTRDYKGKKYKKNNILFEVDGTLDELSSFIGLLISKLHSKSEKAYLTQIQSNLYTIMSQVSGFDTSLKHIQAQTSNFETIINKHEKNLPKQNKFLLPQGSEISCLFHVCRVMCRRAERQMVAFTKKTHNAHKAKIILSYINRLSDLLFILSRVYNDKKEIFV